MTCFELYLLFARIGFLTFGGGYAMLPLFQDELVVKNAFLTGTEFANLIALAQITPGPIGLNAATYIGYQQAGVWGALAGTLGVITPSLILGIAVAGFLETFRDSPAVKALLSGIRPATLGLIASAVLFFAGTSVFTAPLQALWSAGGDAFRICVPGTVIFALTWFVDWKWKPNILLTVSGAALAGVVLSRLF